MKAYLPKTRPLSGDYPEKWFGDPIKDAVSVFFEDSQYDDWIGFFPKGQYGISFAALLGDRPFAFVIAHGQGYVVDLDAREVVCISDSDYLQAAIIVSDKALAIAADYGHLYAFNSEGSVWEERSVAMDGIRLKKVVGTKVYGEVWSIDWKSFVLDTADWELTVS